MTIRESIIKFLEENPDWQYGGHIARNVAVIHECKESNVERRIRELENEGKIERKLLDNPNGRGNKVVAYRLSPVQVFDNFMGNPMQKIENLMQGSPSYKPEILKAKLFAESQPNLL